MTPIEHAITLLDRAHAVERHAANAAIRIPRDLAHARRALRAALLRASCPDATRLADELSETTARLMASGRGAEAVRARADMARVSASNYRPDIVTPEISEAIGTLRQALAHAESLVAPRVDA